VAFVISAFFITTRTSCDAAETLDMHKHNEEPIVLSFLQARVLCDACQAGEISGRVSLDLGRTRTTVTLDAERVHLPDGQWLAWPDVETIAEHDNVCYVVQNTHHVEKIQRFSAEFNRLYTLMPASSTHECPPTMLISGIPMHRIKETDPQRDTQQKIRAAGPFTGPVLDTATGLGYTAIAAAEHAEHVTTIELDPTVLDICRLNPWSQALFDNPQITQKIGDSEDVVAALAAESFTQILHDPPMFSLAGHLYSTAFYRELWRVLRRRGKLFHYIGNPDSKSGRSMTNSVLRRLQEAGFQRVKRQPRAFGVVAFKA